MLKIFDKNKDVMLGLEVIEIKRMMWKLSILFTLITAFQDLKVLYSINCNDCKVQKCSFLPIWAIKTAWGLKWKYHIILFIVKWKQLETDFVFYCAGYFL